METVNSGAPAGSSVWPFSRPEMIQHRTLPSERSAVLNIYLQVVGYYLRCLIYNLKRPEIGVSLSSVLTSEPRPLRLSAHMFVEEDVNMRRVSGPLRCFQ